MYYTHYYHPRQSYTAIWFTTQSTRQIEPQTLWTVTSSISERILTKYRTTLQVCYFSLYVVAISLIVCQNALCHFVY